jgi:hypothetical protein
VLRVEELMSTMPVTRICAALLCAVAAAALPGPVVAQTAAPRAASVDPVLPPVAPWSGKSEALALAPDHPWATPAERTGLTETPRYEETVAWLRRLAEASPEIEMVSIGRSPEQRDIWLVIASRDRAFTPAALRATGKAVVFA